MKKIELLAVWVVFSLMPVGVFPQNANVSLSVQEGTNHTVNIQWTTNDRPVNLVCTVERSTDKENWERVARMANQFSYNYFAIDSCPFTGSNYYRIKFSNAEGQIFFSDVQCLQITVPAKLYTWPNPANEVLHIRSPYAEGNIDIIDAEGKFINKIFLTNYITDVHIAHLPKGMYFLHLRYNNRVLTKEFLKN